MSRPNLQIVTGAQVHRVIVENGAATGVEIEREGVREPLQARAEVILCAGAVGSPTLLEASGIGGARHLKALGIEVRADRPEVGANASDHLMVQIKLRLRKLSSLNGSDRGLRAILTGLQYLLARRGPLSRGPTELIGFMRLFESDGPPDVEIWSNAMTYQFQHVGGQLRAVLDSEPGMSFNCYQCYPQSTGHVHLTSNGTPEIVCNYLTHEFDQKVAVAALRTLRKICRRRPLADHIVHELAPGGEVGDRDEDLLAYAAQNGGTVYHLSGTCRMGSDEASVVDQELRVRGVRRLRVADASVMPRIMGTHINAPTMMIGERAAEFIRQGS